MFHYKERKINPGYVFCEGVCKEALYAHCSDRQDLKYGYNHEKARNTDLKKKIQTCRTPARIEKDELEEKNETDLKDIRQIWIMNGKEVCLELKKIFIWVFSKLVSDFLKYFFSVGL